jgi:DNA invertase Pin-like site-specific DNA recombinase
MPAYAYLRKSSVHDLARELSHEVQEAAVREMATRRGDSPLILLSDWDKSGRLGADKRPGYRALLDAIASGKASAVYSYSMSRLARSVPELTRLIADCDRRGIPVTLYADPIDTSSASGKLVANMLASVAQFEADIAQERINAANRAKLARGESLRTVRLYGEGSDDDAGAVLAAFREAGSFSGAAKLLNDRDVKPRNSTRGWWPSAVAVVVKRLDPSIGTRRPSRGYAAGGTDFILARLLQCPTCGTMLTGTQDRAGRRVRYSCRLGTAKPHQRISVTEHLILPAIRAEVDRVRRNLPNMVETAEADAAQRAELGARRVRIVDLFESGHIDRADRETRLEAVRDALERLDSQQVVAAVPEVDWTWHARDLNKILGAFLERVDLDSGTFQPVGFAWRLPAEYVG